MTYHFPICLRYVVDFNLFCTGCYLLSKAVAVFGRHRDFNSHACSLYWQAGIGLQLFDTFGNLGKVWWGVISSGAELVTHLALCSLVLFHTKSSLGHRFLDHPNGIRALCRRIHAFFSHQSRDFFAERCEVVVTFFFPDLDFSLLKNLKTRWGIAVRWLSALKGERRIPTSFTISPSSNLPKAFWRSPLLAASPLETFTKTLLIWRTSSRFVSLWWLNEGEQWRLERRTRLSSILVLYFCSRQSWIKNETIIWISSLWRIPRIASLPSLDVQWKHWLAWVSQKP